MSNLPSLDSTTFLRRDTVETPSQEAMRRIFTRRLKGFCLYGVVLLVCFAPWLGHWAQLGLESDIFSYILLIPPITLYLVWLKRQQIPIRIVNHPLLGLVPSLLGLLLLGGYLLFWIQGRALSLQNHVALTSLSFVLLFHGGLVLFLGMALLRFLAFPLAFLFFMVPFPVFLTEWVQAFYQHTSADLSFVLLKLAQVPVFREGMFFQLPGIIIHVARECSGIRSSLVLMIASLLAGHLLLKSHWRRAALALFVIPLGIFRNGLRILTISLLCVHVGPHMIDSPIHHRGGPVFFVLSLVPLFLLLWILRRSENRRVCPSA